jgi:hypothetical protein
LLFYQECQWCNAESREKTVGASATTLLLSFKVLV